MFSTLIYRIFVMTFLTTAVLGFCGDSIRWSHNFKMHDVYGMWYGVGYAQHTPDMTNKPKEVGCVKLHITDVTTEHQDDLYWSVIRSNYTDQNWQPYRSNSWPETSIEASGLDIRLKRLSKRDTYNERRLRVLWDEDGHIMEQMYTYTTEEPGLWVIEKRSQIENILDIWYPDNPPRHPQVVRVLKSKPNMLIINHCSETGNGGIFSLILRRSPSKMKRWEWYDIRKQFYSFELPNTYRYSAICAGCNISPLFYVQISVALIVETYRNIYL